MLERLRQLFSPGPDEASAARRHSFEERQLAAAALLVEAASMDSDFGAAERATIGELLRSRFGLSGVEADEHTDTAHDDRERPGGRRTDGQRRSLADSHQEPPPGSSAEVTPRATRYTTAPEDAAASASPLSRATSSRSGARLTT